MLVVCRFAEYGTVAVAMNLCRMIDCVFHQNGNGFILKLIEISRCFLICILI